MAELGACTCCGEEAFYTILLSEGPNANRSDLPRYYIPNDFVRDAQGPIPEVMKEVGFCRACMRVIEDNFRATILYLQAENGLVSLRSPGD